MQKHTTYKKMMEIVTNKKILEHQKVVDRQEKICLQKSSDVIACQWSLENKYKCKISTLFLWYFCVFFMALFELKC